MNLFDFFCLFNCQRARVKKKLWNEQFQPQDVTTWSDELWLDAVAAELKWLLRYLICILSGFIKAAFLSHTSKKEKNESHPRSEQKWWLSIHLWMCSRIINVGSCDCIKGLELPLWPYLIILRHRAFTELFNFLLISQAAFSVLLSNIIWRCCFQTPPEAF